MIDPTYYFPARTKFGNLFHKTTLRIARMASAECVWNATLRGNA